MIFFFLLFNSFYISISELCVPYTFNASRFVIYGLEIGQYTFAKGLIVTQSNSYTILSSPSLPENPTHLIPIQTHDTLIQAYQYKTNVSFECWKNISIEGYSLYIAENQNLSIKDTGFNLGFFFNDQNFSFVHLLKSNNLIDKPSYTFRPTSPFVGSICFGSFDKTYPDARNPSGICKVKESSKQWECLLKGVYYENNTDDYVLYNEYVSFKAEKKKCVVPCSFLDYLEKYAFKAFFHSKKCMLTGNNNKIWFECDEYATIVSMPKIKFQFEEFTMVLTHYQFIPCYYNQKCISNIKCYMDKKKKNMWIIGSSVLEEFVSTFDYSNRTVELVSAMFERHIEINKELRLQDYNLQINYIIIGGICINCIGIAHLIINKLIKINYYK